MGDAEKKEAQAGGVSGWGEAEGEASAMSKAAGKRPGQAGPQAQAQAQGRAETDGENPIADLAPGGPQERRTETGRDAMAGIGEVEIGEGRNPEGLRTGKREQLRPKPGGK